MSRFLHVAHAFRILHGSDHGNGHVDDEQPVPLPIVIAVVVLLVITPVVCLFVFWRYCWLPTQRRRREVQAQAARVVPASGGLGKAELDAIPAVVYGGAVGQQVGRERDEGDDAMLMAPCVAVCMPASREEAEEGKAGLLLEGMVSVPVGEDGADCSEGSKGVAWTGDESRCHAAVKGSAVAVAADTATELDAIRCINTAAESAGEEGVGGGLPDLEAQLQRSGLTERSSASRGGCREQAEGKRGNQGGAAAGPGAGAAQCASEGEAAPAAGATASGGMVGEEGETDAGRPGAEAAADGSRGAEEGGAQPGVCPPTSKPHAAPVACVPGAADEGQEAAAGAHKHSAAEPAAEVQAAANAEIERKAIAEALPDASAQSQADAAAAAVPEAAAEAVTKALPETAAEAAGAPVPPEVAPAAAPPASPRPSALVRGLEAGGEAQPVDPTCAVCLAEFARGDMVKALPPCGHTFHATCIDSWLATQASCPYCRHPVVVTSTPAAGERAGAASAWSAIAALATGTVVATVGGAHLQSDRRQPQQQAAVPLPAAPSWWFSLPASPAPRRHSSSLSSRAGRALPAAGRSGEGLADSADLLAAALQGHWDGQQRAAAASGSSAVLAEGSSPSGAAVWGFPEPRGIPRQRTLPRSGVEAGDGAGGGVPVWRRSFGLPSTRSGGAGRGGGGAHEAAPTHDLWRHSRELAGSASSDGGRQHPAGRGVGDRALPETRSGLDGGL